MTKYVGTVLHRGCVCNLPVPGDEGVALDSDS